MVTPDEEFDRYIPQPTRDNYRAKVAAEGGDWAAQGRQFAIDGEDRLARWAYHEAEKADQTGQAPPRARSAPRKETAAA